MKPCKGKHLLPVLPNIKCFHLLDKIEVKTQMIAIILPLLYIGLKFMSNSKKYQNSNLTILKKLKFKFLKSTKAPIALNRIKSLLQLKILMNQNQKI